VIKKGDSLWTIATQFHTTVAILREINGLKVGAILRVGQVIRLP